MQTDKEGQTVLDRILIAQDKKKSIDRVVQELANGFKASCWIWWIFPAWSVIRETTRPQYSLSSLFEGQGYLKNSILSERLLQCVQLSTNHFSKENKRSIEKVFSHDVEKFLESMTFFLVVSHQMKDKEKFTIFLEVFEKGNNGELNLKAMKAFVEKEGLEVYKGVETIEQLNKLKF